MQAIESNSINVGGVFYLENHAVMPFQNLLLVWAAKFRAGDGVWCGGVADTLLFSSVTGTCSFSIIIYISAALSSIRILSSFRVHEGPVGNI